jgi:hypothetical protein
MYRHMRKSCKIANSESGMEKLIDHTLRQQLAQTQAIADMKTKMDEMALLLGRLNVSGSALTPNPPIVNNIGQIHNTSMIITNNIHINAWDGERRIGVEVRDIVAMLAENAAVREYTRLGDHEAANPAVAPPYVMELLMDLTKRAHADPAARNVYLNPRRADQVLVHMTSGRWEVLSLAEATRLIFDGIARAIMAVSRRYEERRALPIEAQSALAIAGLLYDDEPDEYVKRARGPMAAHLANTTPGTDIAAPRPAAV